MSIFESLQGLYRFKYKDLIYTLNVFGNIKRKNNKSLHTKKLLKYNYLLNHKCKVFKMLELPKYQERRTQIANKV